MKKIVRLSLLSIFFAFSAASISSAEDLPALFEPVIDAPRVTQTPSPVAADRMRVSPDFSLIDPDRNPVAVIAAALPGKTVVLLRSSTKKRGADNYTWFGKVDGYELSTVVLTVVDGIMQGYLDFGGESYSISPDNGEYMILRNDQTLARPFDEGPLVPPAPSASSAREARAGTTFAEDGSVIDVLVLYTQEMYDTYGPSGDDTLNTKIQAYIDLANGAYANSGVGTSLRLAHSSLYTAAAAAESVSINDALDYITTDALAIIGPLRETYSADLVSLLRHHSGAADPCGLAWIMQTVDPGFESYAFSVVEVRPAAESNPYYCSDSSFAHELGHNMGCAHDRAHTSNQGAYPYSYGYDYVAAGLSSPKFATIMSYVRPTINYFSAPSITYSGVPIGVTGGSSGNDNPTSSADNARTINNTKVTVANFRVSDTTPPTDGTLTATPGDGQISLSWTAASDSGGLNPTNPYKVVRSTLGTPATQCAGGTQVYIGSATSKTDTGLTNGTTYYYRVCAYDTSGNISAGAPDSATLPVHITVTTSPSGLHFALDGSDAVAPQTYVWNPGAGHGIAALPSPQDGTTGTRYAFSSWNDSGAQSHSIAPTADRTFTANFTTQYMLTLSASGSGTINPDCSGGCWYNSGSSVGLLASPDSGSVFSSWGGDCSGASPSLTAVMDMPRSCIATFAACADKPAKNIMSDKFYASISGPGGAYADASNGDTIRLLAAQLTETLNLSNISVTLSGGWNCGFTDQTSFSIIHGSLTTGAASLTAERLIIY